MTGDTGDAIRVYTFDFDKPEILVPGVNSSLPLIQNQPCVKAETFILYFDSSFGRIPIALCNHNRVVMVYTFDFYNAWVGAAHVCMSYSDFKPISCA
jgi:hypothetical protein